MAASEDGEYVVQLGYKVLGGAQIGYFVFADGSQSNLSGYPDTRPLKCKGSGDNNGPARWKPSPLPAVLLKLWIQVVHRRKLH
jgi:hypothetical protein